jgi:hypothetical protein
MEFETALVNLEECGMQILHSQGDMAAMYSISDKIRANGYDLLLFECVDDELR